jgi:hypothetical protein
MHWETLLPVPLGGSCWHIPLGVPASSPKELSLTHSLMSSQKYGSGLFERTKPLPHVHVSRDVAPAILELEFDGQGLHWAS